MRWRCELPQGPHTLLHASSDPPCAPRMWAEGGRASSPGVPLKPMLAKICEGIADGLKQLAGQVGTRRARARGAGARMRPPGPIPCRAF